MKEHVAMVVRNDDGDFMFIQRALTKKTLPGAWSFPSGTIEEGEDVLETARRECKEEFGVKVLADKVFGSVDLSEFDVRLHFVLCYLDDKEPKSFDKKEIEEIEWFSMEDFFERFEDDEIGHGLVWLRKNPEVWSELAKR